MEFLQELLQKITMPSNECTGISISSDSKMEVVVFDTKFNEVRKYKKVEIEYDYVRRQVNIEEFEASLILVLNELEIPLNNPIYTALPNILTSIKTLPSDIEDAELEVALNSEAEKSYIFKKSEPRSNWNLIDTNKEKLTNTYVYSVLQREQIEKIEEIFIRNGLKLITIDTTFAASLRGLSVAGVISDSIENREKWCLITVSSNNYMIARFEGENLVNVIETPLALRSMDAEALYSSMSVVISEKIGSQRLDSLYIVSQIEEFTAQKLADHLKIICEIHTIDSNKFRNKPMFLTHAGVAADLISPECVGAACWGKAVPDINFNFSTVDTKSELQGFLGNIGVKKPIHLYLLGAMVLSGILILSTSLLLSGINGILRMQTTQQEIKINELKKRDISAPKIFNLNNIVFQNHSRNLELLNVFDAIGAGIPEKVWIDSFLLDNKMNAKIQGRAYSVEDIIIYYENIQKLAKIRELKIKFIKTEQQTEDDMLPLPPMPGKPAFTEINQNPHYRFVFSTPNVAKEEDPIIDKLPEPLKKIFGN